ncbi:MAG: hypothetical protein ACP5UO_03045 [Thermoplasmata archaeon]
MKRSFNIAIVILSAVSLLLLSLSLVTLAQTGETSMICSGETPVIYEYTVMHNGSTTLHSKIKIFDNGSLPLNYLSGPEIIVYSGVNRTSISNYNLTKVIPTTIPAGSFAIVYVNITVPYKTEISYFFQIDYYVGSWKPNPFLADYSYVKYFVEVNFEWEG